jgi:hypothetical protein
MTARIASIFLVSLYEGLIAALGCPRGLPGCQPRPMPGPAEVCRSCQRTPEAS